MPCCQMYTRSHMVLTSTDLHQHTQLPLAGLCPSCPSPWVGLRQRCLCTLVPTGSGACLLPASSVPLPRPDLVDFSKLTKSNANYNLQRAFRTAEQHLGLARLLDPEGESCGPCPDLQPLCHPKLNSILPQHRPQSKVVPNPNSLPVPPPSSSPPPPLSILMSLAFFIFISNSCPA